MKKIHNKLKTELYKLSRNKLITITIPFFLLIVLLVLALVNILSTEMWLIFSSLVYLYSSVMKSIRKENLEKLLNNHTFILLLSNKQCCYTVHFILLSALFIFSLRNRLENVSFFGFFVIIGLFLISNEVIFSASAEMSNFFKSKLKT